MSSGRIFPEVKLIFACDRASRAADGKYVITNPWHTVQLPPGASFPFAVIDFWVYLQLAGGVGSIKLCIEMHLLTDDGGAKRIGRSPLSDEYQFTGGLQVIDLAVQLKSMPFDEPGLYEFRALAGYNELAGTVSQIRVLPASEPKS